MLTLHIEADNFDHLLDRALAALGMRAAVHEITGGLRISIEPVASPSLSAAEPAPAASPPIEQPAISSAAPRRGRPKKDKSPPAGAVLPEPTTATVIPASQAQVDNSVSAPIGPGSPPVEGATVAASPEVAQGAQTPSDAAYDGPKTVDEFRAFMTDLTGKKGTGAELFAAITKVRETCGLARVAELYNKPELIPAFITALRPVVAAFPDIA